MKLEGFISLLGCIILLVLLAVGIAHFFKGAQNSAETLEASAAQSP
ncbi:MAG TPA: hypothetical protein VJM11_14365 [Nevskiaceae bacterium]|nr:hypothetical protein [Nevskiaceae bacterium]